MVGLRFGRAALVGVMMTLLLAFAYLEATGGWWEYALVTPGRVVVEMVNDYGWQLVDSNQETGEFRYLRRARIVRLLEP